MVEQQLRRPHKLLFLTWLLLIFSGGIALSACDVLYRTPPSPDPSTLTDTPSPLPSATLTALPQASATPSQTPEPLAALVNNEAITLAEFQAELARFQVARQTLPAAPAAPGINLATDTDVQKFVLDELINQRLLAQAAYASGFTLSQETLQARLDGLTAQIGGADALQSWMTANQYDTASFQAALARSIAVAWMRDQIAVGVPNTAEQIHARQILLYNLEDANQVLAQLQSGRDFADLAFTYDPAAGGELGWFPRGYLTEPELENAAFQLEAGAYTGVIQTSLGFHILQVIEREAERPLEPDARFVLQENALRDWLQAQWAQSNIQISLP